MSVQSAPPLQHQLPWLTLSTQTNLWFLQTHQGQAPAATHTKESELVLGADTSPLTGREWGPSPDVSLRFLKCFSSVRERNANLWVAQHRLEKFCFLLLSLSPRFFPANDGHMHICETNIYLYFLSSSLLLCSDCPSKVALNQC